MKNFVICAAIAVVSFAAGCIVVSNSCDKQIEALKNARPVILDAESTRMLNAFREVGIEPDSCYLSGNEVHLTFPGCGKKEEPEMKHLVVEAYRRY